MNPAWWFLTLGGFGFATFLFVSAFFFPHWKVTYARSEIPLSVRGKKAMGLYFAYFGLAVALSPHSVTLEYIFMAGILVLIIALYPVFLRDKRDYQQMNDN